MILGTMDGTLGTMSIRYIFAKRIIYIGRTTSPPARLEVRYMDNLMTFPIFWMSIGVGMKRV